MLFLLASITPTDLFGNYLAFPPLFLLLLLPIAGLLGVRRFLAAGGWWAAFGLAGISPALLATSLEGGLSLTVANASSSPLTLKIMLAVAVLFVPIVLAYQAWRNLVFSQSIGPEGLAAEEES